MLLKSNLFFIKVAVHQTLATKPITLFRASKENKSLTSKISTLGILIKYSSQITHPIENNRIINANIIFEKNTDEKYLLAASICPST